MNIKKIADTIFNFEQISYLFLICELWTSKCKLGTKEII